MRARSSSGVHGLSGLFGESGGAGRSSSGAAAGSSIGAGPAARNAAATAGVRSASAAIPAAATAIRATGAASNLLRTARTARRTADVADDGAVRVCVRRVGLGHLLGGRPHAGDAAGYRPGSDGRQSRSEARHEHASLPEVHRGGGRALRGERQEEARSPIRDRQPLARGARRPVGERHAVGPHTQFREDAAGTFTFTTRLAPWETKDLSGAVSD